MAVNKITNSSRNKIISKSVNPLPNTPSKLGYSAQDIKNAMFKFVTDEEESIVAEINRVVEEINNEGSSYQPAIDDLSEIRSNAQAGKNASDTISSYGDVVSHDADEFATASQGARADTAVQPDAISDMATKTWTNNQLELKQDEIDNTLNTIDKTIAGAINEVNNKASGMVSAKTYSSISAMVTALNLMSATELKSGSNIYIVTEDVPDLWIGKVEENSITYTYTSDSDFISAITGDLSTTIQVGYYRLCKLESEKVDLSNYVTKETGKGLSTNDFSNNYKEQVELNTDARHEHSNKSLLDTYTQTESDLADAVLKKHTHTNKSVLDATTASFTTEQQTKLAGIAEGAQVNTVTSVNNKTGAVNLTASDVGALPDTTDYLKSATVSNNELIIVKQDDTSIAFQGGGMKLWRYED